MKQTPEQTNPQLLWLVRHGESTSNRARQKAEAEKLLTIDFPEREPDVPLSDLGIEQAVSIGRWFRFQKVKPTVAVSSPFVRASETARIIAETARFENQQVVLDERLRERELGIFDRLTKLGAYQKYAEECAKREHLGKFYHRPPNGESWADVALRVRNFRHDLRLDYAGEKVLIVTHEVVIRVFRYVLENLTEKEILAIDAACDVGNCAVTSYHFSEKSARLEHDNFFP